MDYSNNQIKTYIQQDRKRTRSNKLSKPGNFYYSDCGDVYFLAMVDYNKFTLVSLKNGNRYSEICDYNKIQEIIKKEGFELLKQEVVIIETE